MAKDLKGKDSKKDIKAKEVKSKKKFFKDFKAELKKVIWPTPKQIVNNTIAVVVIVLIVAFIVFVLDVIFDLINEKGINNFKRSIKENSVVEQTAEGIDTTSEISEEAITAEE